MNTDSRVFYLKYRLQKFSELDSIDVREALIRTVKSGKIPHALLFAGPKGTGKTSAARVLAKAVNCLGKKKSYEPCNRCDICREITTGTSLDLIEVDAASNRGIDDIRNLREKIKLSPAKCQYKVYIIDEVHMLTTEAFNALLKTLEEPPAHAIFILCTTAPEKLPDTIVSRCTRFNFRKGKLAEVVGSLKKVVKGEKLKVEDEVLKTIAKSADGSFRDAQKILEQLVLAGAKISLKKTKKLLQQTEELSPKKLLTLLAKKDVKASLLEIDRIVMVGGDLNVYLQQILDSLRLALLNKVGLKEMNGPVEINHLKIEEIKLLIKLFFQAFSEQKLSPIPQLPLELAAIEFCGQPKSEVSSSKTKDNPIPQTNPQTKAKLKEVESKWPEILAHVKPLNHSVEALLRGCRPIKIDGQTLTLEVFYKFHKERLETEKCRQVVEEAASQILGNPIRLSCILGEKPNRPAVNPAEDKDFKGSQEPAERRNIVDLANDIFNN
ncbi:MAG TPA: DNA polymerase III subunit gamma/tau [Nevskiaceae bacterium]|nr:DNA polymerase III subunit gamma/tau [Nevskiaceae bacterium]